MQKIVSKIKEFKHHKTLINGGLFSLYSFFSKGIGFLLLILLANYILPADYGKLSLFNTVVTFLSFIIGFSSEGYFSISYFQNDAENFKKDFASIFNLHLITLVILLLVLFVFNQHISKLLNLPLSALFIAVIMDFFNAIFNIHQDYYRIKERVTTYGLFNCSNALANFALTLLLVIVFHEGWKGRVNASFICSFVFGIISIIFFLKNGFFDLDWNKDRYKRILIWSLPIIPHLATSWLKQGLDQYIINYNYSTYEVGLFSFALNLNSIIIMIGSAFNATNSVSIFQVLSDKKECKLALLKKREKYFRLIYFVATILIVVSMTVLVLVALPKYRKALPFFIILSGYGFLQCIYFIYCNYFFYYKKTKNLMYITFGTAILHLCLSLAFTRYSLYFTCFIYLISMSMADFLVIKNALKLKTTIERNI